MLTKARPLTDLPGAWRCAFCAAWFEMPPWTGSKKRGSGTPWPTCCGTRAEWVSARERSCDGDCQSCPYFCHLAEQRP